MSYAFPLFDTIGRGIWCLVDLGRCNGCTFCSWTSRPNQVSTLLVALYSHAIFHTFPSLFHSCFLVQYSIHGFAVHALSRISVCVVQWSYNTVLTLWSSVEARISKFKAFFNFCFVFILAIDQTTASFLFPFFMWRYNHPFLVGLFVFFTIMSIFH